MAPFPSSLFQRDYGNHYGRLKGENYSSPLVEERSVKVSLYSAQAFQNNEKGFKMRFEGRISPADSLIRVFRTVLRFLK